MAIEVIVAINALKNMLGGALARHGITRQVTAAMVVVRANEVLAEMLGKPLVDDVRALSFRDGRLSLACRHASAAYDAEPCTEALAHRLEEAIPDVSIVAIDVRVNPEPWREW